MGKKIGIISDLCDKAMANIGKDVSHVRNGNPVYQAYVEDGGLILFHYGTIILHIFFDPKKVVSVGGWSNSDRDAINTVLDKYGFDERVRLTNVEGKGWGNRKGKIVLEGKEVAING